MSQSIARLGDKSVGHCFEPRSCTGSSPNVFINGIGAHRIGDGWPVHRCGNQSHSSVTSGGSSTVFINGLAVGRVGDPLDCGDCIGAGSSNVFAG